MAIHFHLDSPKTKIPQKGKVKSWLENVLAEEGAEAGRIHIYLTSGEKVLELNKEFLSRNVHTDVLAFSYPEKGVTEGEIFINIERVNENAVQFRVSFYEELMRVIVHGILHLIGYEDRIEHDRKKMHEKEDYYLEKILPEL